MYLYGIRDIATASIGPRSSLATGPEELEASKWELEEDTEHFIQAAEVYIALINKTNEGGFDFFSRESFYHTCGLPTMFSCFPQAFPMAEWRTRILRLLRLLLYLA